MASSKSLLSIRAVLLEKNDWHARRDSKREAAPSYQLTEGRPVEASYSIQLSYGRVKSGLYRLYTPRLESMSRGERRQTFQLLEEL